MNQTLSEGVEMKINNSKTKIRFKCINEKSKGNIEGERCMNSHVGEKQLLICVSFN